MTTLQRLEEVVGMDIPQGAPASTVAAIVHARLGAAETVKWLRPELFPEDDDV